MSLKIIKAGILDTIQDQGRFGNRHLGINPSGVMDRFSSTIANYLVGNNSKEAVIEMHFPASTILFEQSTIIALSGADFTPSINGEIVPLLQPIIVSKNSVLQFSKLKTGTCCYLAVKNGLNIPKWLNSYSTNLKVKAGGWNGRSLTKDVCIATNKTQNEITFSVNNDYRVLPWKANTEFLNSNQILVIKGAEWESLTDESKNIFLQNEFTISNQSDRMGFQLYGKTLNSITNNSLVSSAVSFGTIQLVPSGKLIVLMADHQTTGGYPRIAHVITACLSSLAQMKQGSNISFKLTDQKKAEELFLEQEKHLTQIQNSCNFKLNKLLYEKN